MQHLYLAEIWFGPLKGINDALSFVFQQPAAANWPILNLIQIISPVTEEKRALQGLCLDLQVQNNGSKVPTLGFCGKP